MRDIYLSENGDAWFLTTGRDGEPVVLHRPNAASGGQETALDIEAFLARNRPGSPQRDALMRLIAEHAAAHRQDSAEPGASAHTSGPRLRASA